jgi:hypothetical protein
MKRDWQVLKIKKKWIFKFSRLFFGYVVKSLLRLSIEIGLEQAP